MLVLFPPRENCSFGRCFISRPDDWPPAFLAVSDVGDRVFSATAPSLSGVSCTRSQRSIESKSMESFFGARSDCRVENRFTPSMSTTASLQVVSSLQGFYSLCSRFPLGRLRSSISSGKQAPLKSHCLSAETEKQPEAEVLDYLPLASQAHILRRTKRARVYLLASLLCLPSGPSAVVLGGISAD